MNWRYILTLLCVCFFFGFNHPQKNVLHGKWQICWESQLYNPPSFIACKYKIVFKKDNKYEVLKEDKIVGKGKAEFVLKSTTDKSQLYQMRIEESPDYHVILSTFIPNRSLFAVSAVKDKIFFLNEDMELSTPYFLNKN